MGRRHAPDARSLASDGHEPETRYRLPVRPGQSTVTGCGRIPGKRGRVIDRTLGAYALVYVVAGTGTYADAAGARPIRAGDAIVCTPAHRHSYAPDAGGWDEWWLTAQGPCFDQLAREGVIAAEPAVSHPGISVRLVDGFAELLAGMRARPCDHRLLTAQAHALFALTASLSARHEGGDEQALVEAACALICERLAERCDGSALARRLGVSPATLRRVFVRQVGCPPGRWRMRRRIERAKAMLDAGVALAAVAEELGYCDEHFLARQFHAVAGMTPGAWRRRGASGALPA